MKFEIKQNFSKSLPVKIIIFFALGFLFPNAADGQTGNVDRIEFKKNVYSKRFYFLRTAYGDLTEDQDKEAVILLRSKEKQRRSYDKVLVYSLKTGKFVKIADFNAGRRGEYVLSIQSLGSNFKIEEKIFVLDLAVLREGEDVPTHYYTIKYRWNGIQMEESERSCLKPLSENMYEVG